MLYAAFCLAFTAFPRIGNSTYSLRTLTRNVVTGHFCHPLASLGVKGYWPGNFFRQGTTTWACEASLSDKEIQLLGRWYRTHIVYASSPTLTAYSGHHVGSSICLPISASAGDSPHDFLCSGLVKVSSRTSLGLGRFLALRYGFQRPATPYQGDQYCWPLPVGGCPSIYPHSHSFSELYGFILQQSGGVLLLRTKWRPIAVRTRALLDGWRGLVHQEPCFII